MKKTINLLAYYEPEIMLRLCLSEMEIGKSAKQFNLQKNCIIATQDIIILRNKYVFSEISIEKFRLRERKIIRNLKTKITEEENERVKS